MTSKNQTPESTTGSTPKVSKRKFLKSAVATSIVTTVASNPVFADHTCSVSGNLSGNLSNIDNSNHNPCVYNILSPGALKQGKNQNWGSKIYKIIGFTSTWNYKKTNVWTYLGISPINSSTYNSGVSSSHQKSQSQINALRIIDVLKLSQPTWLKRYLQGVINADIWDNMIRLQQDGSDANLLSSFTNAGFYFPLVDSNLLSNPPVENKAFAVSTYPADQNYFINLSQFENIA